MESPLHKSQQTSLRRAIDNTKVTLKGRPVQRPASEIRPIYMEAPKHERVGAQPDVRQNIAQIVDGEGAQVGCRASFALRRSNGHVAMSRRERSPPGGATSSMCTRPCTLTASWRFNCSFSSRSSSTVSRRSSAPRRGAVDAAVRPAAANPCSLSTRDLGAPPGT